MTETIRSRQHPLVKEVRRIARGDDSRALLDGEHLLEEALAADVELKTVVVAEGSGFETRALLARARKRGAQVLIATRPVLDAMSPTQTPAGIVTLIDRPAIDPGRLLQPAPALVLLAVDMQDPGNVGAIIRAAEAGGATGVALSGTSSDPWSWKALRAAMGSTLRLPVIRSSHAHQLIVEYRRAGLRIVAAVPRGGTTLDTADLRPATALVIGGEGAGLPEDLLRGADERVSIPMQSRVESLNAAVAAALLVYEARRQRSANR